MKWAKRGALALGALLFTLALVEAAIQLAGDPRLRAAQDEARGRPAYWTLANAGILTLDDETLRFRLAPGFDATVEGVRYRVNSLGLRGGEIEARKPDGTKRVLVVGDSYAFGLGVSEADALPGRLEAALRASGCPAAVVNFGIPAYHTGQELALLERIGFALEPELVVLLYYANDNVAAPLAYAPSVRALYVDETPIPYAWKAVLSRSYLWSRLVQLDSRRRHERGDFDARGSNSWPVTERRLRAFAAACRERGVAFLFAPLQELAGRVLMRDPASEVVTDHQRVLALAAAETWPTVDLGAGLLASAKAVEKFFLSTLPVDNHLNAGGHAILCERIAPEALRLLARE